MKTLDPLIKNTERFPLWHSGLRILPCHSCGMLCSLDFIPGPKNFYVPQVRPKKKKKNPNTQHACNILCKVYLIVITVFLELT